MRNLLFAALAAVPLLLVGWVVYQGTRPAPGGKPLAGGPAGPAATASAAVPAPEGDPALLALFEGDLAGCQVKEKVGLYDHKGLFDYIDGAAPVFIERGFRKLAAAELATADGAELTCDVYDMASPDGAKAIFEKERSASAKAVDGWPEALAGSMSFVFRAGRYYVKLTAFDASAEAALPALARAIRQKVAP